jgi:hypothetical protein
MRRFIPAGGAAPLIVSACFVFGFLYASVVFHRLEPIWSPEQKLLLATTTVTSTMTTTMTMTAKTGTSPGSASQQDNNNNNSNNNNSQQDNNNDNDDDINTNVSGGNPNPNDNGGDFSSSSCWNRSPPVWPHSLVVTQKRVPNSDSRVGPATTITYYDYDRGGNLIQIIPEHTDSDSNTSDSDGSNESKKNAVVWDLELNTGHSYYFVPSEQSCTAVDFPVGILRPDWLQGATPMGPSLSTWRRKAFSNEDDTASAATNRLVCGWTKADFIDYYADASTGLPDSWYFHTMKATFYVLNYTAIDNIDPALFVPPDYCFS